MTGLILVGALLLHVGMVFLTLAPDNAVSERHEDTIKAYVQPQFRQNWRLFAPNPMQRDDAIGARVRIGDGARTSEWINVTAMDIASIRHSLAPSHVSHNMLRKGWQAYVDSHDDDEEATDGEYSYVIAAYVKRIVLQRIGREWHGEPITAVQIAGRFTRVTPPSWSDEEKPRTTAYRVLPWWNVSDQDYRGL
ncbi:DUF5819 family protein [Streptomyces neyagawaensis]|uniref:DUF5819 family protein n=1 Tax=Streptomyces neyagawaensis TaxID=42238 RepID=A0ABV3AW86_9ACTN